MNSKLAKSFSFNKKTDTKSSSQKGLFSKLGSPFTTQSQPNTPTGSPPHGGNDYLSHNNTPELKEKQLAQDIEQCRTALDYFLDSNIKEAEAILKPHYKDSMYYSLGYSFILYLKSVMTFQEDDIEATLEVLKHTIQLAGSYRKRENGWLNSMTSWVKGTTLEDVKNMTVVQRHAELVYAEAYLLKALLSIIHDESVMSFLRESLNIRSSYSAYMTLEKYVDYASKNEPTKLDKDFTSGVSLGVGCFSLILSMLPASVVKVAEFIGFSSDRAHGLKVLESVDGWSHDGSVTQKTKEEQQHPQSHGLRSEMCNMVLIVYHIILSKMIPLSDVDIPFAETILDNCLSKYPRGVFFLYFNGRLMVSKRLLGKAEEQYQLAIDTQKEWKQLQHMCFWELGLISIMQQNWQKAYDIYTTLQRDSNWSKAVYTYLKAITLYKLAEEETDAAKKEEYMKKVVSYMDQVTGEKQRIAGKSIPMEKYVARKARKFLAQGNYLLLPDLEVLNAFTAYDFMPVDILETGMKRINAEISRLEQEKPTKEGYYDDLCLAEYLRAITARMLFEQNTDTAAMHSLHEKSLQTVFDNADNIQLDHYIYYFSHYENARMLILDKNYTKAESEIQVVLKANDRGQYSIGSGPHAKNKYSLASALVFKCHNCMTQIKSESKK